MSAVRWELLTGVIVTVSLWDIFVPLIGHPNTTAKNYNSYLTTLAGLLDCEKYSTKKNESLTLTNYRFYGGLLLGFNKEQVRKQGGNGFKFHQARGDSWLEKTVLCQECLDLLVVRTVLPLTAGIVKPVRNQIQLWGRHSSSHQIDGSITVQWSCGRSRPSWDVERKYLIWQIHSSRIKIELLPSHYTTLLSPQSPVFTSVPTKLYF